MKNKLKLVFILTIAIQVFQMRLVIEQTRMQLT